MCHGLASVSHARDGRIAARVVLCLVALVALMATPLDAVEEIHLPLPPPVQGLLTAGPYNFQFTGEDHLRLTVANSLAGVRVAVHYRTAPTPTTTQANRQELTPTADRAVNTMEFDVVSGYLLNVVCFASSGAPQRGQTYVKLEVIRGFGASGIVLGCVCAGYVTATQPIAWPGSPMESSLEGTGYVRSIQGTNPAAGAEIAEVLPVGARWDLLAVVAALTTDATVINRYPQVLVELVSPTPPLSFSANDAVQASSTKPYTWAQGLPFTPLVPWSRLQAPLATPLLLVGGGVFLTLTINMQPGDNWGAPVYLVREWLDI
jgi:hypothetical protein